MISNKKYIAVEGAIGVGKTTLVKRISNSIKCDTMFEDYADNPFLKTFYDSNSHNSFSTQLYFLLKRLEQSKLFINNTNLIVSDFYFGKDDLFAKLNLNEIEYSMYCEIREKLNFNPPTPDLIIYLQAPTDILIDRIKKRNLSFETKMKKNILSPSMNIYMKHFHEYKLSPLLIINTSNVNIYNENDFQILIKEISSDINGKKYFNPTSL